jgi:tetratricopeptide (TPR) repeat protein
LEAQQALLVELLRRAGGEAVSYAELRDRGIELPASVVSELELAGFPIERCYLRGTARQLGVRLDPTRDPLRPFPDRPAESAVLPLTDQPGSRVTRRPIEGRPLIAFAALVVVALAAIVLGVTTFSSGGGGHRPVAHRASPRATASRTAQQHVSTTPSPPTPVSETLAYQLEAEGHDLLQAGNYAGAVPTLRKAMAATGEQLSNCLQPVSENCLTYAYALYDLGRALRLSGDSAAAVPVLEQRLQIDNQRPVVLAELALARSGSQPVPPR